MVIISLIEEHILPVFYLIVHCVLLKNSRWAYAMLFAKLLPEFTANLIKHTDYFGFRTAQFVML